jgi:hypothetical protein
MPVQSIDFEVANIVNPQFKTAPHLDVQIRFADESLKCAAIESKFCEPYGQIKTTSLNPAYLREKSLWQSWPHLHSFAHPISTEELAFSHLDAAQLIRHLLGLQKQFGNNFVLIYLWFDMPGVTAAQAHRNEIEQFHSLLLKDHISFISRTYQEVIKALHNNEIDSDKLHSKYLIQRYLDLEL